MCIYKHNCRQKVWCFLLRWRETLNKFEVAASGATEQHNCDFLNSEVLSEGSALENLSLPAECEICDSQEQNTRAICRPAKLPDSTWRVRWWADIFGPLIVVWMPERSSETSTEDVHGALCLASAWGPSSERCLTFSAQTRCTFVVSLLSVVLYKKNPKTNQRQAVIKHVNHEVKYYVY